MNEKTHPQLDFFKQNISYDVWYSTYKWDSDETVYDTFQGVVNAISTKDKEYKDDFFEAIASNRIVPAGRVLSNARTGLKNTTWANCFVKNFDGENQDSMTSIMKQLSNAAMILKSEGGYGTNINPLRPAHGYIQGIGVQSPGPIRILEMWNKMSDVITAGSEKKTNKKGKNKIRKGAMMVTMSIWHPSIIEYIEAKNKVNYLDRFNMSVNITDDFMEAKNNDENWDLIFPDFEADTEFYNKNWDGDIKYWQEIGGKVVVWQTIKAKELWDILMTSTYNRNDPGVVFIDRVNQLNNLNYIEKIFGPNPCGEQNMPDNSSCILTALNLVKYVKNKSWDYELLEKDIYLAVRMLDNVTDLTNYPLSSQKKKAQEVRRIGLGIMGYGSALYLLKLPYGGKKALNKTDDLMSFIANKAYEASAFLAKERGAFPLYDEKEFLQSKYLKQAINNDVIGLIKKYGIRNGQILTIAPTGNTGIFSNNVSGGLEPVISDKYIRTRIVANSEIPDDIVVPKNVDWVNKTFEVLKPEETAVALIQESWKFSREGSDDILRAVHPVNGKVYKFDSNRGLTVEDEVYDYAVLTMDDYDPEADYAKNLFNITLDEHVNTMSIFAKYIDNSISKTINVPNDISYEEFKNIYDSAYAGGYVKGLTTYRFGTTMNVVKTDKAEDQENDEKEITPAYRPPRPDVLPADVHRVKIHGEDWIVFVGLMNNAPYEVFAGKIDYVDLPKKIKQGEIIRVENKKGRNSYQFSYEGEVLIRDISQVFNNKVHDDFTTVFSYGLGYGIPLDKYVSKINQSDSAITDFSKSIARALKKYIKDGEQTGKNCPLCGANLMFVEGCETCIQCSYSAC